MRGWNIGGVVWLLMTILALIVPPSAGAQSASSDQYYAAGVQMYNAHNYSQAIQYFNAAIKLNSYNAMAYQAAGNCYYALGNKQYALAYYQRDLALQPTNTQLAQLVQTLQAQINGGGMSQPGMGMTAQNPLNQGYALLQQRQYAAAIPYLQQAAQQNPADYRAFYFTGYAYAGAGDSKDGALYFEVAATKSGNASIKAYADRIKNSLSSDDQQWVDDQASKYLGSAYVAANGGSNQVAFGFHLMGGMEDIFSDPTQIKQYVAANGGVSLNGVTPNVIALPELEPFVQLGQNFEINMAIGYFPVGNLSYTTYDYNNLPNYPDYSPNGPGPLGDVWKYTFNTNIVTVDLGVKFLFGDSKVKGYLGLGGGISPISMTFTKVSYDPTGTVINGTDASSGNYSTVAFNGQAILGVDFVLGKGVALGPYIGYRYLSATNFQNGSTTLAVDTKNGAVGLPGAGLANGRGNFALTDPNTPLNLDFSGLEGGVDLTFSF